MVFDTAQMFPLGVFYCDIQGNWKKDKEKHIHLNKPFALWFGSFDRFAPLGAPAQNSTIPLPIEASAVEGKLSKEESENVSLGLRDSY